MIAAIRGEVLIRRPGEVVIDCGGVGYRLAISAETLASVPESGKVSLHAHLIARDDALQLYGFSTEAERELFLMLIGVQNVGPKVALAVLSGGPPRVLLSAIATGDIARFQTVPGIGKRTAERIIVELKEKVAGAAAEEIVVTRAADDPHTLACEALVSLGFGRPEAEDLVDSAGGETAEELIADALRAAR